MAAEEADLFFLTRQQQQLDSGGWFSSHLPFTQIKLVMAASGAQNTGHTRILSHIRGSNLHPAVVGGVRVFQSV